MGLTVTSNQAQAEAQLDRFADALEVARPRIVNKLLDQAETAGFRTVADLYQVGPRTMEKYATIDLATGVDPTATIRLKGRGFGLDVFKPIATRKGVSFLVKGKRVLIAHAFMVKRFGAHVFARGAYGGKGGIQATGQAFGRFIFGKGRLPIHELFTFGPVEAFSNPEVVNAMNERVDEQGPKVAAQELRFATR